MNVLSGLGGQLQGITSKRVRANQGAVTTHPVADTAGVNVTTEDVVDLATMSQGVLADDRLHLLLDHPWGREKEGRSRR